MAKQIQQPKSNDDVKNLTKRVDALRNGLVITTIAVFALLLVFGVNYVKTSNQIASLQRSQVQLPQNLTTDVESLKSNDVKFIAVIRDIGTVFNQIGQQEFNQTMRITAIEAEIGRLENATNKH
jgi:hypothetical protein